MLCCSCSHMYPFVQAVQAPITATSALGMHLPMATQSMTLTMAVLTTLYPVTVKTPMFMSNMWQSICSRPESGGTVGHHEALRGCAAYR